MPDTADTTDTAVANLCLSPQHLMSGWLLEYSYSCQPVDYSHSPTALRVSSAVIYMSVAFTLKMELVGSPETFPTV
jgi:hypothetical protein